MTKQWKCDIDRETGDTDIMPLSDLIDHLYGLSCPCLPQKDTEYDKIIVHNSLDGREELEKATNKIWVC